MMYRSIFLRAVLFIFPYSASQVILESLSSHTASAVTRVYHGRDKHISRP